LLTRRIYTSSYLPYFWVWI